MTGMHVVATAACNSLKVVPGWALLGDLMVPVWVVLLS